MDLWPVWEALKSVPVFSIRGELSDILAVSTLGRMNYVLGEIDRIDKLLETSDDALGLALMDEHLPQRVRVGQVAKLDGSRLQGARA